MDNLNSRETAQNDSPLRSLISRIFGGMGVGTPNPPTIYGNGGLPAPVVQKGIDAMHDQMPPPAVQPGDLAPQPTVAEIAAGLPNAPLAPRHPRATPSRPPAYDVNGMDELTGALSGEGVTEGPNANIGNDTRERALAYIQALRNGGAIS